MAASSMRVRRQIVSATELQAVVRAMKAQAAAGVAQYEQAVPAVAAYARVIELGLAAELDAAPAPALSTPADTPGPGCRAVVFGSDQGLVGRFNDIVADRARQALHPATAGLAVWAVGEGVGAALRASGLPLRPVLALPTSVAAIAGLVATLLPQLFEDASPARKRSWTVQTPLLLFYNRPIAQAAGTYAPVMQSLLPWAGTARQGEPAQRWPPPGRPERLGTEGRVRRALIREHLFVSLFRACADSLASENASRLAAMERADDNIDQLLAGLQSRFQHQRQTAIDEDLSDVTAGFRALAAQTPAG